MTRIRLYIDEDAKGNALLKALRSRGVDVITVRDAEMLGRTDEEQLEWAFENNRVLYTFNVGDFYRLHTLKLESGESHAGIIFGEQQTYSVGEQMRRLLRIVSVKSAEEMQSHVEFLTAWREA